VACWEAFIGAICKLGLVAALVSTVAAVQRPSLAEPQQAPPTTASAAYRACVDQAAAVHDAAHAAACKRFAETTEQNRAECTDALKLPLTYCNASYPPRDGSANCVLPDQLATIIDAALEQARYRCARENAAAAE
jgi:hypothetical protein